MKLSNKVYDIIKYCLFTVVPTLITLISSLNAYITIKYTRSSDLTPSI